MLEILKAKRDALALKIQNVENEDLTPLVEERLEALKAKALEEIKTEQLERINKFKEELEHYDYVINDLKEDAPEEPISLNL